MAAKILPETINAWNQHRDELLSAAVETGIDPVVMVKIAGFESNFDPTARPITGNPTKDTETQFDGVKASSTAYGYGQILNGTWRNLLNTHGVKYGVENASNFSIKEANDFGLRTDTKLQAAMLAELTKENIDVIDKNKIGGGDIAADIYAMHNLGLPDGKAFFEAYKYDPSQLVSDVLKPNVIANNRSLYADGKITLAEAYQNMANEMNRGIIYVKNMHSELPLEIPENAPLLRLGDQGQVVRDYQSLLVKSGYQVEITGSFDEKTLEVTQQLQQDCFLSNSKGVVGFETYVALNATISERPYQLEQTITARYAEIAGLNEKYQTTTDVNERKQLEADLSAKRLDVSKLEFERSSLLEEQSAKLQNQKTELTHQFAANAAKITALENIQQKLAQVDSSQSNAYASIQHDFNQAGISLLTPAQERVANKETLDLTNKADITALQDLLHEEGLFKATARGAFGDQTKTALREALGKEADYAFDTTTPLDKSTLNQLTQYFKQPLISGRCLTNF